jgi:hypothetical protein
MLISLAAPRAPGKDVTMLRHGFVTMLVARTALLAAATMALSACASQDRLEIRSTVPLPATVSIEDAYTGQVLWKKEVPVGYTLVADLGREGDFEFFSIDPNRPATAGVWRLYGPQSEFQPVADGRFDLPGTPVLRRITYRPAPEYPPQEMPLAAGPLPPLTVPAPAPAPSTKPGIGPSTRPAK